MNSKNLHKHAVPIFFFSVAVFIAVATLSIRLSTSRTSLSAVLTTPVISVSPKSNGMAEVHVSKPDDGAAKAVRALSIAVPLHVGLSAATQ